MRIHVLKRKSSALEGERGRPVVNIVVVPEFRVASWGEHAACLDVVDVPIQKPSLADCGGRKEPQRHVFHQVQHRSAPGKSRSRSRTAIMRGGGGACRPAAARRRCGARRVALPRRAPSRCVASQFLFFLCLTSVPWHRCDGAAGLKTRAADHGRRTARWQFVGVARERRRARRRRRSRRCRSHPSTWSPRRRRRRPRRSPRAQRRCRAPGAAAAPRRRGGPSST